MTSSLATTMLALMLLALTTGACAQTTFNVAGHGSDQQIHSNGTAYWVGQTSCGVGRQGISGEIVGLSTIFVFELPPLAGGDTITGAHLSINLTGGSWVCPASVVDAYGLGYRSSSGVLPATDFYQGAYGGDATDATPIQHGFGIPVWPQGQSATVAGIYGTDAAGDQALVDYLAAQYAAGAVGGDYVFIRLNDDTVLTEPTSRIFASGNSATPPVLTVILNGGVMDEMPIADAGPDQGVIDDDDDGSEQVALDGSGSSDPDGTIENYSWTIDPTEIATGVSPTVTLAVGSPSALHVITLTVTDDDGYTDTDTVEITVADPHYNEPPTADAGGSQRVNDDDRNGTEDVALDGSASTDSDGTIISYMWTEGGSQIATGVTPVVTFARGAHTLTLTVTDDDGDTDTDTVNVTVIDPDADRLNLPAPTGPRFPLTEKVWPTTAGEAHLCLWADDAHAAVSIGIDDNNQPDHAWWIQTATTYDFRMTWFVITDYITDNGGYFGTWADFEALRDLGHDIQSHTVWHLSFELGFDPDDPAADITVEYRDSQAEIESRLGNRCLTLAYPGGVNAAYNDQTIAAQYYIAARGTGGLINKANQIDYMNTYGIGNGLYVSNPATDWAQLINLFDATAYNATVYRGWYVTYFHALNDTLKAQIIESLDYLQQKDAEVGVWIAPYREAALYGQQRDSATLTVTQADPTQVRFTLTDRMIDSVFDYPLTIKVRLFDPWDDVSAAQNGQPVDVAVIEHEGAKYALVRTVPDRGEMVLTPISATQPGDADGDGDVDLDDFVILKTNFGVSPLGDDRADFDGDGDVDLDDFVILKTNFGAGQGD